MFFFFGVFFGLVALGGVFSIQPVYTLPFPPSFPLPPFPCLFSHPPPASFLSSPPPAPTLCFPFQKPISAFRFPGARQIRMDLSPGRERDVGSSEGRGLEVLISSSRTTTAKKICVFFHLVHPPSQNFNYSHSRTKTSNPPPAPARNSPIIAFHFLSASQALHFQLIKAHPRTQLKHPPWNLTRNRMEQRDQTRIDPHLRHKCLGGKMGLDQSHRIAVTGPRCGIWDSGLIVCCCFHEFIASWARFGRVAWRRMEAHDPRFLILVCWA